MNYSRPNRTTAEQRRRPPLTPASATLGVVAAALLLPSGCAAPALTPPAEDVRVLQLQASQACRKLGRARVRVTPKLLFFRRSDSTVASELETLARNAAAEMEGNAVAPEGPVEDGNQRFGLYRCADSDPPR